MSCRGLMPLELVQTITESWLSQIPLGVSIPKAVCQETSSLIGSGVSVLTEVFLPLGNSEFSYGFCFSVCDFKWPLPMQCPRKLMLARTNTHFFSFEVRPASRRADIVFIRCTKCSCQMSPVTRISSSYISRCFFPNLLHLVSRGKKAN